MKLGQAHKTRFWYRLGVFSKFSDEHPRHLYRGVPPGVRGGGGGGGLPPGVNAPPPPPHNNRHPDFLRVPLLASVKAKSAFFFQYIGQKPALLTEEKNIHITSFGLFGVIDLYRRTSYATSSYKRPPPIGDHQSASYLNTNISPVKSLQLTPLENDQPF